VLPADGFESYVEWARAEQPANLRDALVAPNHTQGYTLGLQYARPVPRAALAVRVQAELTNVEQSATFADRPIGSWYTSRAAIQGYTNRGQVMGASIGPGSSGQWLGADALARQWSGGVFAGRIRWDNDAYYTIPRPTGNGLCKHDVSVLGGVRGTYAGRFGTLGAAATFANRLNTFYQHSDLCFVPESRGVDTRNTTLTLSYSAPVRR
jgi:hypothetical protein